MTRNWRLGLLVAPALVAGLAAEQAGPVGKLMLDIQHQLVTALLADESDAALAPMLQDYTAAAAKMGY